MHPTFLNLDHPMTDIRRGTLKAFDSGTYKATLQLEDSRSSYATNVPVSRGIASAELSAGRAVAVVLFNPDDINDAMVVGVY